MTTAAPMQPRVVVAVDLGTTFTGFAYAHSSQPEQVFTNCDWPMQDVRYCKTRNALYYSGAPQRRLVAWGWPAQQCAIKDQRKRFGNLMCKFRELFGADRELKKDPDDAGRILCQFNLLLENAQASVDLPSGLTAREVVSDYLRALGDFIVQHLKKRYGRRRICKRDIQWCVTVPATWSDSARRQLHECMEQAELVGAGRFPLVLVPEREAAAWYSYTALADRGLVEIHPGEKFLVADVGGRSTDVVVHERVNRTGALELREVTARSGAACGSADIDSNFLKCVHRRICCLRELSTQHPTALPSILQWWEQTKRTFKGTPTWDLVLPRKVARAWAASDGYVYHRSCYNCIHFSVEEILSCFDPVVDKILDLIAVQMAEAKAVKVIVMVGGLSGSPYLMKRIRGRFGCQVVRPLNPGSAVCQGAVLRTKTIKSRILTRTYGLQLFRDFQPGDPIAHRYVNSEGKVKCLNPFVPLARRGAEMSFDACVQQTLFALDRNQQWMLIALFSSTSADPKYTTDKKCRREGEIVLEASGAEIASDRMRVEVSVVFGATSIQVTAVGTNFGDGKPRLMSPVNYVF
jgi:hypothetical protein